MNTLEISVLSPAIVPNAGSEPIPQEQTWSDFLPLSSYFPNVIFLGSSNVGSAPLKRSGENLPGKHGIYPVYSPVSDTQKQFEFLVRSPNSEIESRETVKNFVKWLYSQGEIRISFNEESQYRRMMYNSGSDYNMINGVYGYDAHFTFTLTCIDSLSYSKEIVSQRINYSYYGGLRKYYGNTVNPPTIDYTPISFEHPFTTSMGDYQAMVETSFDGITRYYISFTVPSNLAVAGAKVVVDSENYELYLQNGDIKTNLLNYVRTARPRESSGIYSKNYISTSFPFVMSSNTYFAYIYDASTTITGALTSYYRPRVLAYD